MINRSETTYGNVTVIQRSDYKWGVVNAAGKEVVPFGKYGWIDGFDSGLARVRTEGKTDYTKNIVAILDGNFDAITDRAKIEALEEEDRKEHPEWYAKWGIINEEGEEVLPVEYDSVWKFLGKNRNSTRVEKDGDRFEVYFHDLNPSLPNRVKSERFIDDDTYYERDDYGSHYGEFAGTYAQDVMGYSDDVINDAFDGEPDAYWNID